MSKANGNRKNPHIKSYNSKILEFRSNRLGWTDGICSEVEEWRIRVGGVDA